MIELIRQDLQRVIPQTVTYKICQPIITAELSRHGNRSCLSMCYDSIKAYGSELKVEKKEGEGTELSIELLR